MGAARRRSTSSAALRRPEYACRAQEGRHALLGEGHCGRGRGIAVEEVERDGRFDISEDSLGPRPELLEETAELVAKSDTLRDQVVANADEAAQCLGLVGKRSQRAEPMSVGAQEIGEQIGVAEIGLTLGSLVVRARG